MKRTRLLYDLQLAGAEGSAPSVEHLSAGHTHRRARVSVRSQTESIPNYNIIVNL